MDIPGAAATRPSAPRGRRVPSLEGRLWRASVIAPLWGLNGFSSGFELVTGGGIRRSGTPPQQWQRGSGHIPRMEIGSSPFPPSRNRTTAPHRHVSRRSSSLVPCRDWALPEGSGLSVKSQPTACRGCRDGSSRACNAGPTERGVAARWIVPAGTPARKAKRGQVGRDCPEAMLGSDRIQADVLGRQARPRPSRMSAGPFPDEGGPTFRSFVIWG